MKEKIASFLVKTKKMCARCRVYVHKEKYGGKG